jgi:cytoskeletal protein CcmA (bactofilin family)
VFTSLLRYTDSKQKQYIMDDDKKTVDNESDSLENLEEETKSNPVHEDKVPSTTSAKKSGPIAILKNFISKLNIYLLAFLLLVIIGIIIAFVLYNASTSDQSATIETQELTQEAVDELVGSDAKVGDPKQLLTIESDSVFTGKVLIRDGLDVAGPIKVGGSLSLPGITVSGASAFDEVTINTLNIAGDATVQGQLSVQNGLTVSGPVTFSGTFSAAAFSIQSLQVDQDLTVNRHIDAGGQTPGLVKGAATGSGGTVTISGTDTAGTVTVNIGSGASAGTLASVNFVSNFSGIPHVVITPIASQGSAVITGTQKFYLSSRTSNSFSIAVSAALPAGSISFDYIVID